MVVHVAHTVALKAELGGEVHEDVLDLLLGEGNLSFRGPSRVRLSGPLASRQHIPVVHSVVRSGRARGAVPTIRKLGGWGAVASSTLLSIVLLISTAVIVHVGGARHVRPHGEIAESLGVLLGAMATTLATIALIILIIIRATLAIVVVVPVLVLTIVVTAILVIRVVGIGIIISTG
jgi:hypothetical protein